MKKHLSPSGANEVTIEGEAGAAAGVGESYPMGHRDQLPRPLRRYAGATRCVLPAPEEYAEPCRSACTSPEVTCGVTKAAWRWWRA